jgi:diguanylate cyclase (GGDEF)-like protein/PAS domain S-box-containing protein
MVTLYLRVTQGAPFSHSFRSWFAADAMGIAMATPLYLSNHYGRKFSVRPPAEIAALFVLICAVTFSVFYLATYPMLWLVLLFLLLLGVRLGFTGSALGLLLVTFIGGFLTVEGFGPLGTGNHGSLAARVLIFQLFICFSMLALYVTEVAMAGSRRVLLRLETSETRFRSLAEASRDVIILSELSGKRKYVSPAMTELLGWDQEELIEQHYAKIIHDEDKPRVQEFMQQLRVGGGMTPVAYRCRKRDGQYLWLEATARLLSDPQTEEPYGFVYVLRDISDRKAAEQKMQEAFQTAERLAMMDGLTGVANRRLLDQTLSREWISSRRDRTPLSVLLIDVDCFKAFNDQYGHLEGDECLCRVASRMQAVLRRPLDLLARYGGEEFVAVLPNTPADGAEAIAELLRKVVQDCNIPHTGSPHSIVTISVGCATQVACESSNTNMLLSSADAALYVAKSTGRNRTQCAGVAV